MVQNLSKDALIQQYLDAGYRARDIDAKLQQAGLGGYNPLTYSGNIKAIPGRAAQQAKALGRDLTTFGGDVVNTISSSIRSDGIIRDKFINAVNSEPLRRTATGIAGGALAGSFIPFVGTIGGGLLGGSAALLGGDRGIVEGSKDLVNALLSTYGTNLEEIRNRDVNLKDVVQGILDNPLYAGMDILSFGGAKALGRGGKALTSKTGMTQKVLPGKELADLNRRLTNAKLWSAQNTANIYTGYNKLNEMPMASRSKIVDYIVSGTGDLDKKELALADQLRKDLIQSSKQLEDLGIFEKDFMRNNTIAQYVMNDVRKDTNLLHKDIMDILEGNELRPSAAKMFEGNTLGDRVLNLIDEGANLYDNNKTAFLSQRLANSIDPMGEVVARHENLLAKNPNYARIIGRATPEQIGNVLEDTIKMQLDRSSGIKSAIDIFGDLINNDRLGIEIAPKDKSKYISAFRESLKRDIRQDRIPNFEEALSNSGIDTALKTADKSVVYESLKGFFRKPGNSITERFSKKFKKNVLGVPSWSVGNRLGNWSMNAIEGIEAVDYGDIKKYSKLIPDALKLQTSYNSYLDVGNEALAKKIGNIFTPKSIAKVATEFKKSYGRYKNSDRTISDKVKYLFDTIGDIGNITASPIFEAEAKMEYLDRAANYIRQAKRYAEANNMKLANVLRRSKRDKDLFFELNTKVNKSLGDYYGRNYALPSIMQDTLRLGIPFYRFPVQTLRVTGNALTNPATAARFASNVTIPARAGNVLSNRYINQYNLNRDEYKGGSPYIGNDGSLRLIGMTPTPLGIVAPRLTNPKEFSGMLNPLFSGNIIDMLDYKKFDKTPSSPRYSATKRNAPMEAVNYQPTLAERLGFAANEILGTTYNPYIWGTRILPQIYSLYNKEGRTPFYNTMQPIRYKLDSNNKKVYEFEKGYDKIKSEPRIQFQDIEGYKKTTPLELLGNQIGISNRSVYQNKGNRYASRQAKTLLKKTIKNIEKNR